METKELIGIYLRNLRKQRKLSQESIAKLLGVKRQTYSTYETGRVMPATDILINLSKFYDISLESFLKVTEESVKLEQEKNNLSKFSAASFLFDPRTVSRESELINLFRNVEARDQDDILEFLKLKVRQCRNMCVPQKL